MEFNACVKQIKQLQEHLLNVTGVSTQFLEGCDLTGYPFSKNKRMEYLSLDVLPDPCDVILAITKAINVKFETNRKSAVWGPIANAVRKVASVFETSHGYKGDCAEPQETKCSTIDFSRLDLL